MEEVILEFTTENLMNEFITTYFDNNELSNKLTQKHYDYVLLAHDSLAEVKIKSNMHPKIVKYIITEIENGLK